MEDAKGPGPCPLEVSAGNREGFAMGLKPDFSLSGVLALNNIPRINGAGSQQR